MRGHNGGYNLAIGEFTCQDCRNPGLLIFQAPEGKQLTGYCYEHAPAHLRSSAVISMSSSIYIDHSAVSTLVIHKPRPGVDTRGALVVTLRSAPLHIQLFQLEAIKIMQFCTMLIGHRYAITEVGGRGEQNDCWIEPRGNEVSLINKYWGPNTIRNFIAVLLAVAEAADWEVEDERLSPLERLARA